MYQIILEIEVESIDFSSENFERSIIPIKTFKMNSDSVSKEEIDDLVARIVRLKGDWYYIDYNYNINDFYIKITFIFHTKEFTDGQKELVDKVLEECKRFFVYEGLVDYKDDENLSTIFENDGFIISYSNDEEAEMFLNYNSIVEMLKSNNIDCKTISINRSETQCGAGNVFDNFMIFIVTSVQSGITWDIIKMTLSNKLGINFDKIKIHVIDNIDFKILRRTVADRINESPKSITLTNFYRDSDKNQITISMKCKRKHMKLICDKNYVIKEMSVE